MFECGDVHESVVHEAYEPYLEQCTMTAILPSSGADLYSTQMSLTLQMSRISLARVCGIDLAMTPEACASPQFVLALLRGRPTLPHDFLLQVRARRLEEQAGAVSFLHKRTQIAPMRRIPIVLQVLPLRGVR